MLKMRAVYWDPLPDTDEFGNKVFAAPVEIKCRWEERVQEYSTGTNQTMLSNAVVYVDRDLRVKGVLKKLERVDGVWQGLDSLVSQDNPFANEGAWEVNRFDKLPTMDARQYVRTAYL
jgi:hypothetical protein